MYNAFISYSHNLDKQIAASLQSALQRFAKPWFKLRRLHIFRDEASLAANPYLWKNIESAIRESEYLIYLASPTAAKSKWVVKELDFWIKHKPLSNLLIVLTEGEILWNDSPYPVENPANAIPPVLSSALTEEPFFIDLRFARQESDLSLRNPIYKNEILKLSATLLKREPKDLASEEVTLHRRMLRIRNSAVILLVALLIFSFFFGYLANVNSQRAERNAAAATLNQRKADSISLIALHERDLALQARNLADSSAVVAQQQRDSAKLERDNAVRQEQVAVLERNKAQANYLITVAKNEESFDPTLALRLAEEASRIYNGEEVQTELTKIYSHNSFYYQTEDYKNNSILAVSPDGKKTFSLGYTDFKWEIPPPQIKLNSKIHNIEDYLDRPSNASFSNDGKMIAYSPQRGHFAIIDSTGKKKQEIIMPDGLDRGYHVHKVAFSPDDSQILTRYDASVWITTVEKTKTDTFTKVSEVRLSHDHKKILLGFDDGRIRLVTWDGATQLEFKAHNGRVVALAFSIDDSFIATSSFDSSLKIWNRKGILQSVLSKNAESFYDIRFSNKGDKIAAASFEEKIRLWDIKGYLLQTFIGPPSSFCNSMQFSKDDLKLYAHYGSDIARHWIINSDLQHVFKGDSSEINSIASSPDGKWFITCSDDSLVRLRDRDGKTIKSFPQKTRGRKLSSISNDGKSVLIAGDYNEESDSYPVWLYTLDGELVTTFNGHSGQIKSLSFSPNGILIMSSSMEGRVIIWDRNGKSLREIETNIPPVFTAFAPNKNLILAGGYEDGVEFPGNFLQLLDYSGKVVKEFELETPILSASFSPDGKQIVGVDEEERVFFWDLAGNLINKFLCRKCGIINKISFTPSGKEIVTLSNTTGMIDLWDLKGNLLKEMGERKLQLTDFAFLQNGLILTGAQDGFVRIWKIQEPVNVFLKNNRISEFTAEQRKKYNIKK